MMSRLLDERLYVRLPSNFTGVNYGSLQFILFFKNFLILRARICGGGTLVYKYYF